ncbi:hypothetical protein PMI03_01468 [Rhizobium sp. AP16]|nr:hypothetical protein PMI03_01468 [Rhizobium sp. AP16]
MFGWEFPNLFRGFAESDKSYRHRLSRAVFTHNASVWAYRKRSGAIQIPEDRFAPAMVNSLSRSACAAVGSQSARVVTPIWRREP